MKRHGRRRPKAFTTRLGKVTVRRSCRRLRPLRKGPLSAGRQAEARGWLDDAGDGADGHGGSQRSSKLAEELSGAGVCRSRFDREARSLCAEAAGTGRRGMAVAADGPPLPVVPADGAGVPVRKPEIKGRAGRRTARLWRGAKRRGVFRGEEAAVL